MHVHALCLTVACMRALQHPDWWAAQAQPRPQGADRSPRADPRQSGPRPPLGQRGMSSGPPPRQSSRPQDPSRPPTAPSNPTPQPKPAASQAQPASSPSPPAALDSPPEASTSTQPGGATQLDGPGPADEPAAAGQERGSGAGTAEAADPASQPAEASASAPYLQPPEQVRRRKPCLSLDGCHTGEWSGRPNSSSPVSASILPTSPRQQGATAPQQCWQALGAWRSVPVDHL